MVALIIFEGGLWEGGGNFEGTLGPVRPGAMSTMQGASQRRYSYLWLVSRLGLV